MAHGEIGLAVGLQLPILAEEIAVATYDFLGLRIPHDELLATVGHGVELVDVHAFPRAATSRAKGYLAKAANLLHDVRSLGSMENVNLVVALVRHAKATFRSQLTFQYFLTDGLDNLFFHS